MTGSDGAQPDDPKGDGRGQTNTTPAIDPATNRFNPNQGYGHDKNGNLTTDGDNREVVSNGENKPSDFGFGIADLGMSAG